MVRREVKISKHQSNWVHYTFKLSDFLEKLELPRGSNVVSITRHVCPDSIEITVRENE